MGVLADQQWSVLEPFAERGPSWWLAAPDPTVPPDDRGDRVAAAERGQVACDPRRAGPVVDGGADLSPLGQARGRQRLHRLAQERRGLELGMVFLDGTVIRAIRRRRVPDRSGDGRDLLRAAHRLPVERAERDRHLLLILGASALSGVGRRPASSPSSGARACWPTTRSPGSTGAGWRWTGPWARPRWVGKKTGRNPTDRGKLGHASAAC